MNNKSSISKNDVVKKSRKKRITKNPIDKFINELSNPKDVYLRYIESVVKSEIDKFQVFYENTKDIRDAYKYISNTAAPILEEVYDDFVLIGHDVNGQAIIYKHIKSEKDFNALKELVKKTTFHHFVEGGIF
jgi:hypothetical protein